MARGWESKAVEDQMASAEERRGTTPAPASTPEAREADARKAGLILSRNKILKDIERARDERHVSTLRQALAYLDAQLKELE